MRGHENAFFFAWRAGLVGDAEGFKKIVNLEETSIVEIVDAGGGHDEGSGAAIFKNEAMPPDNLRVVPGFNSRHDVKLLPELDFPDIDGLKAAHHRGPFVLARQGQQPGTYKDVDPANVGEHHVARVVQMRIAVDIRRQAAEGEAAFIADLVMTARPGGRHHPGKPEPNIHFRLPSSGGDIHATPLP